MNKRRFLKWSVLVFILFVVLLSATYVTSTTVMASYDPATGGHINDNNDNNNGSNNNSDGRRIWPSGGTAGGASTGANTNTGATATASATATVNTGTTVANPQTVANADANKTLSSSNSNNAATSSTDSQPSSTTSTSVSGTKAGNVPAANGKNQVNVQNKNMGGKVKRKADVKQQNITKSPQQKNAGVTSAVVKPNISRPTDPTRPHHTWTKMYTKYHSSPGKIIREGTIFLVTEIEKYVGIRISRKYPLKVNPSDWATRKASKVEKYLTGYHILNFKVTRYFDEDAYEIYTKDKFTWYLNSRHSRIIGTSSYITSHLHKA